MRAEVEEGLKRQAFRKLLQDPRFNVMDGLDVYIDDYSKPDPLPEGWLEKMNQTARFGDYQEPVPEEGTEAQEGSEAQASPSVAAPAPEEAPDADKESAAGSPEGSEPIHTSNTEASHAPRAEFPRPS